MSLDWPFTGKDKNVSMVIERGEEVQKVSYRPDDTLRNMIEHFYEVVIRREIALFPLAESVKNMAVIDAIFQSAVDNGKLVDLNN